MGRPAARPVVATAHPTRPATWGEPGTLFPAAVLERLLAPSEAVTVRTPSTIGNFGPGFDVTSLAIAWGGDTLSARTADADAVTLEGPGSDRIPTAWADNCAAQAYDFLRQRHDVKDPVAIHIAKGAPPGSGLGSSASSSAAGALAFAKRHPELTWDPARLVEAAAFGEARVAGAHGDDVAAATVGGLALVRPHEVARIAPPRDLHLAIVRPEFALETRRMRAAVPTTVATSDAVANLGNLAVLVDAMHRGDLDAVGRCLDDRLAVPARRTHLPFFDAVRQAALDAGAPGATISGSGPAMFTIAQDLSTARDLAAAMTEAVTASGIQAEAIACTPEHRVVWQDELSA